MVIENMATPSIDSETLTRESRRHWEGFSRVLRGRLMTEGLLCGAIDPKDEQVSPQTLQDEARVADIMIVVYLQRSHSLDLFPETAGVVDFAATAMAAARIGQRRLFGIFSEQVDRLCEVNIGIFAPDSSPVENSLTANARETYDGNWDGTTMPY